MIDEVIQNAWDVTTSQRVVNSTFWNDLYALDDNSTVMYDRFVMIVGLKRRATAYNIVFYTPLLGKRIYFFYMLNIHTFFSNFSYMYVYNKYNLKLPTRVYEESLVYLRLATQVKVYQQSDSLKDDSFKNYNRLK